jgi:hypothetical protein
VKSIQGTTAQHDRLIDGMHECQALKVGEAVEDSFPVVVHSKVPSLAVENVAKLGGLNGRDDQEMLTMATNALQGSDDMIGMDRIDLLSHHDALEDLRVSDRLLALPIGGQAMDGLGGERKEHTTITHDRGGGKKDVELRLLCQSRAPRKRDPASAVRSQERCFWWLSGAPPT